MNLRVLAILLLTALVFAKCSGLKLEPANFAWPVESVLEVDERGNVSNDRYSLDFNTTGVFYEEFGDSSKASGSEIRLLRSNSGYYFLTGDKFKNVYVFVIDDGVLELENKIMISEQGILNPALNQRIPFIELINSGNSLYLTNEGIHKDKK